MLSYSSKKTLIFRSFWDFMGPPDLTKFFFKNQNKLNPIFRSWVTNRWATRTNFIEHFKQCRCPVNWSNCQLRLAMVKCWKKVRWKKRENYFYWGIVPLCTLWTVSSAATIIHVPMFPELIRVVSRIWMQLPFSVNALFGVAGDNLSQKRQESCHCCWGPR